MSLQVILCGWLVLSIVLANGTRTHINYFCPVPDCRSVLLVHAFVVRVVVKCSSSAQ
jgi:hypothetical protein